MIYNNSAIDLGGGVYTGGSENDGELINITNTSFYNNKSRYGAAIYSYRTVNIDKSLIYGNTGQLDENCVTLLDAYEKLLVTNSTIVENDCLYSFAIASCCSDDWSYSDGIIANSIFWNENSLNELVVGLDPDASPIDRLIVTYSNVRGGEDLIYDYEPGGTEIIWLEGNINQNPLFINIESNDFRLQPQSPCIDSGTSNFYFENQTIISQETLGSFIGSNPDMGALEFDGDSSCNVQGDTNNDQLVNVLDIVLLVNVILDINDSDECADINVDGVINILDIVTLVNIILGN